MRDNTPGQRRHFTSYTGVKLPFKLVNPLDAREVENRNTYFLGYFDAEERLTGFDKLVYGEVSVLKYAEDSSLITV